MVRVLSALIIATLGLSACTEAPSPELRQANAHLARHFLHLPFEDGPVQVLSTEHGKLHGYKLFVCHNHSRVCGGSPHGHAGRLYRNAEFDVIKGAYRGVIFYLRPGGDGYLVKHGQKVPLAWDQIDIAGVEK